MDDTAFGWADAGRWFCAKRAAFSLIVAESIVFCRLKLLLLFEIQNYWYLNISNWNLENCHFFLFVYHQIIYLHWRSIGYIGCGWCSYLTLNIVSAGGLGMSAWRIFQAAWIWISCRTAWRWCGWYISTATAITGATATRRTTCLLSTYCRWTNTCYKPMKYFCILKIIELYVF